MASFEQRAGSVRATVSINGRPVKQTFDTMTQAKAWATILEAKRDTGQIEGPDGAKRITAGELWEAYDDQWASKQDTGKWNSLRLAKWQKDPLATKLIGSIVTQDINDWIERSLATPSERTHKLNKPSTVKREYNLMSGSFTWAVTTKRWIAVNPCTGSSPPGYIPGRKPKSLTPEQIEAVCIASGYMSDVGLKTIIARTGAAWLFSLETGMRSGEILRLRPVDYHREERYIHVAAIDKGGRKSSKSGKSGANPSRNVPLTDAAVNLLDRLLASMPADQAPADGFMHPPYIMGINDSQRDANWRKARDRAGLEDFTFHDAKHEACTRLCKFLDVIQLSHAIGTKDVRLLRDTYYNEDAAAAAKLLPSSLAQAPRPGPAQAPLFLALS